MNRRLPLLGLCFVACHTPAQITLPPPSPSRIQAVTPSAKKDTPLGCEAAVTQVLKRHPALAAARAGRRVALARADGVSGLGSFELRLRDDTSAPGEELRAGVRWRLPVPGQASAQSSAAQNRVRTTEAEIIVLESQIARTVRRAHLAVRRARTRTAIAHQTAALATENAQWRRTRVKGGMETEISAQTATVEAHGARADYAAAENAQSAVEQAFAHLAGARADDGPCELTVAKRPQEAHPAVEAARTMAQAIQDEGVAAVRAQWLWPRFFEVTWDRDDNGPDRTFLEVGIPLSSRAGALGAEAEARVSQARARLQTVVDETQSDAKAAEASLEAAIDQRRANAKGTEVAEAQAVAERAVAFGADPRQRLALRRALVSANARQLELEYAVEAAQIELRAARGHP